MFRCRFDFDKPRVESGRFHWAIDVNKTAAFKKRYRADAKNLF
jgi:hypothetical protein